MYGQSALMEFCSLYLAGYFSDYSLLNNLKFHKNKANVGFETMRAMKEWLALSIYLEGKKKFAMRVDRVNCVWFGGTLSINCLSLTSTLINRHLL